ncbi:MAG TPA: hypothetical protein VED59_09090, partial [Acidimicrobiales bacterium]|nr:hypothetical protein [Acidimicrobiales bacterium]
MSNLGGQRSGEWSKQRSGGRRKCLLAAAVAILPWTGLAGLQIGGAYASAGAVHPSQATSTSAETTVAAGTTTTTEVTVAAGATTTTGASQAPVRPGYWLVRSDGTVYGFGAAGLGDLAGRELSKPIVSAEPTPDGGGYWLLASDGGVFVFGDARFLGSTGGIHLNKPIVGMATTPDGQGYWLAASDGGVFTYGVARFFGSAGGIHLNKPIVGMAPTPDGKGYWLVSADGGIFAYGDARFFGSAVGGTLGGKAIVAMASSPDGKGYWLASSAGMVFPFGDAPYLGSAPKEQPGKTDQAHIVALAAPLVTPVTTAPVTTEPVTSASTTTLPSSSTTASSSTTTTSTTTTSPTTTSPPKPPQGSPYAPGSTGFDVSWPQCSPRGSAAIQPLPGGHDFAIVGVNDGTISGFDSCFAAEAVWAGSSLSVYIVLQAAPGGNPPQEASGPKASCAATSNTCEGYDWGYNYARDDMSFVKSQGLNPGIWWIDVETGEGWPTSPRAQVVNAAIVQGALDAIHAAGRTAGIYSTWYQWGQITGSYVPAGDPPLWIPGAAGISGGAFSAQSYCQRALQPGDPSKLNSANIGFADGIPWLVQYGYAGGSNPSNVDPDYACG